MRPRRDCSILFSAWSAATVLAACLDVCVRAEVVPAAPVPKSPFIPVIYRYADTMLEKGRDIYGPQKTGLFLSALDRALAPISTARKGPLTGANPQHDENLLRLLYMLSELSTKAKYREAADAELKWFFENSASQVTHRLPWGRSMAWDVLLDEAVFGDDSSGASDEFFRPWILWDRCFQVVPEKSRQFALGLGERQIVNQKNGGFVRGADSPKDQATGESDRVRHAGFFIRTWSVAFAQTKDEQFLKMIEVTMEPLEKCVQDKAGRSGLPDQSRSFAAMLSFAIDCDGAAHRVPAPLAARLRALATEVDEIFCALPHELKIARGFLTYAAALTNGKPTALWSEPDNAGTTARIGMMCVARYENTGNSKYRDLIHAAADAYLDAMPAETDDVWPGTIGHIISLELAAWRSTAKPVYFERARRFGEFALEKFFDNGPLPRASLQSDHYESATGADTLALALVELHLEILHITAVRYPPNTIDR
jgi:hypothetical protein